MICSLVLHSSRLPIIFLDPSQVCSQCGTSDTPLWRLGPLGPKSMCNACGIRWKRKNSSTNKRKKPPVPSPVTIPSGGQASALSPKPISPTALSRTSTLDYLSDPNTLNEIEEEDEEELEMEDGDDIVEETSDGGIDSTGGGSTPLSSPRLPTSPLQQSILRHELVLEPTKPETILPPPSTSPESTLPSTPTTTTTTPSIEVPSPAKKMKTADGTGIPTSLERDGTYPESTTRTPSKPTTTAKDEGRKKAKHKTTSPPPLPSTTTPTYSQPNPPTTRQLALREAREQRDYERAQVAEIQRALNDKYWGGINPTQNQSRRRTIVVTPKTSGNDAYSDYLDSGGSSSDGDGYVSGGGRNKNKFLEVASLELQKMKTEMAYENRLKTLKQELKYLRSQLSSKDQVIDDLISSQDRHKQRERELEEKMEKQRTEMDQMKEQQRKHEVQLIQLTQHMTPKDAGVDSSPPMINPPTNTTTNGAISSSH